MAASTSALPSAASFSSLFRRSKFASFDPTIAQIYTSNGGDQARGNWGIKRPLHHKRGKNLQIWSVDSKYAQTEWQGADSPVRWMKNMEELNVLPAVDWQNGMNTVNMEPQWGLKIGPKDVVSWRTNSDFALDSASEFGRGRTQRVPNLRAMSDHEFKSFLRNIGKRRKEFKQFMRQRKIIADKDSSRSLLELARSSSHQKTNALAEFMAYVFAQEQVAKGVVQPTPHRVAGLQYQHPSMLQSFLNTKPQPGRILLRATSPNLNDAWTVGFAGMTPTVVATHLPTRRMQPLVFSEDGPVNADSDSVDSSVSSSKHFFRFDPRQFKLGSAPDVVGMAWQNRPPSRSHVHGVNYAAEVVSGEVVDERRSNTYRPGSREYIAAIAPVSFANQANNKRLVTERIAHLPRNTSLHQAMQSKLQRRTTTNETLKSLHELLALD